MAEAYLLYNHTLNTIVMTSVSCCPWQYNISVQTNWNSESQPASFVFSTTMGCNYIERTNPENSNRCMYNVHNPGYMQICSAGNAPDSVWQTDIILFPGKLSGSVPMNLRCTLINAWQIQYTNIIRFCDLGLY